MASKPAHRVFKLPERVVRGTVMQVLSLGRLLWHLLAHHSIASALFF
jgi:hypothetical protein